MHVVAMTRFTKTWLFGALLALSLNQAAMAQGDEAAPQKLVEDAVMQALDVLDEEQEELVNDPQLLRTRIDELITPNVDFESMTKLAVGKFWRRADADQQTRLVDQFKELLLNTYSGALGEYHGQTISFEPYRPENRDDRAVVRSKFQDPARATDVPVIYKLREKNGWKIYDIEVNNISLVTSYRSAFANEVSRGGIDGLLNTLEERNAKKS